MKYILPFLLLVFWSGSLYAEDIKYDLSWVLEQYANDEKTVTGQIDGEEYMAIIASQISPIDDYTPVILVLKKTQNRPTLIAEIDLQGENIDAFNVNIKNDSVHLYKSFAHHGWYDVRYQFKQIDHKFKMIGAEYQYEVMGYYAGLPEPNNFNYNEVWAGSSYNFLTSSAICWQETFNAGNKQKFDDVLNRYKKWLPPKNAVNHQMKFKPIKLPLLDGFDITGFFQTSMPATCYFDHKNKLHLPQSHP